MNEDTLAKVFLRHLVMAASWGIVFVVVFFIASLGIKQQIKEGIQYTLRSAVYETANVVLDPNLVQPVKKNIKEGIEFVALTARNNIKAIVSDPNVKQDVKEAVEYTGEKLKK